MQNVKALCRYEVYNLLEHIQKVNDDNLKLIVTESIENQLLVGLKMVCGCNFPWRRTSIIDLTQLQNYNIK